MANRCIPLYSEARERETNPETPTEQCSKVFKQNSLDLSRKNLTAIPTDALEAATSITGLNLSWNPGIYLKSSLRVFVNILRLDLAHCALERLPNEISMLSKLQIMDLSGNYDIQPSSFLAKVRQLKELRVEDCNLKKIPEELQVIENMEALDISHNPGVHILSADVLPVNIKTLRAVNCGLTELRNIERLLTVQKLDISRNKDLMSLPPEIGLMKSLKMLRVSHCCLRSLPEEIGQLVELEEFDSKSNKALHCLPSTIGRLRSLKTLTVMDCSLSELPPEIAGLTDLEEINISDNIVLRELPATIGSLPKLRKLLAARCAIQSIPVNRELTGLEHLLIPGNVELRILQTSLSGLCQLTKLDISNCSLTSLPDSLENLQKLEELLLADNSYLRCLTPAMAKLRQLRKLDISRCSLTSIPQWFGDLNQLEELLLVGNAELRQLNSEIGRLSRLKRLDVSRCSLTSVPESLVNLKALVDLVLIGNKRLRMKDVKLGCLLRLKRLNISRCFLASIPDELGEIPELEELLLVGNTKLRSLNPRLYCLGQLAKLDISNCSLTTIPDGLEKLQTLEELLLAGNRGLRLNPELRFLCRLAKLDISHCSLTSIPDWLGDLKMLEELLLFGNTNLDQLHLSLCRLCRLKKLDVSRCSLSSLPDRFSELDALTQLNLSDNQFQFYPDCTLLLKSLLSLDISNHGIPLRFSDKQGNFAGSESFTGNCIKFLPVELAFTNLRTLNLEGNSVMEPPETIWSKGIDAIKSYMRAIIPGGEMACADTINVIGHLGAGKTSVAQSLISGYPHYARDEDCRCALQQLRFKIYENTGWSVTVNDFGGHNIYHSVIPIFLSSNGLVVLVYDMSDDIQGQEVAIRKWLLTVLAKSDNARIVIVGTRSDLLSNDKRTVLEQKMKNFTRQVLQEAISEVKNYKNHGLENTHTILEKLGKIVIYVVSISCKDPNQGLSDLRSRLLLMLRPPRRLTLQWCRVINAIFSASPKRLYLTWADVTAICKSHLPDADSSMDIPDLLRYLVSTGQIIWLEDHPQLKNCIFHCPQRLIQLCNRVFDQSLALSATHQLPLLLDLGIENNKHSTSEECLVAMQLTEGDGNSLGEAAILQHFNLISFIASNFRGRGFIVPCNPGIKSPLMLQCYKQELASSSNSVSLRLSFCGFTIPVAFFETSIASILNVLSELGDECAVAALRPDGVIASYNGVLLAATRREGMIELEAFCYQSEASSWSILYPVVKHLSANLAAFWHGIPPDCAILCPVCRRHCSHDDGNLEIGLIGTTLQSLAADVTNNTIEITCPQCVVVLPQCLCYPTNGGLLTVEQQKEVDQSLKKLALPSPLANETPSATIQLSFPCRDVSVTLDGRLLLAAEGNGLLEYSASGDMLSRWLPPKRQTNDDDLVSTVEALSCGRVAVGTWLERRILLLIRVDRETENFWEVAQTLDKVPKSLRSIAANGDLLVVACRFHAHLQLLSLSSGQFLAPREREYEIRSASVTAEKIVTVSAHDLILTSDKKAFVVDAHSRVNDHRLWRHVFSDNEEGRDISADESGCLLYLTVWCRDGSGRVAFICAEYGCELRSIVMNIGDSLKAGNVSFGQMGDRAILAFLCGDPGSGGQRGKTVTVHPMPGHGYGIKMQKKELSLITETRSKKIK